MLNVRSIRSHPTLAPRPQICLIGGNSFYAVAREGELNRGDLGTEADVFCLLENDWEQGEFNLTSLSNPFEMTIDMYI